MTTASTPGSIRIRLFGRTDVGQIREHNEDNFLIADLTRRSRSLMETDREQIVGERGTAIGVCDGMGGAAAGEVASQLAVDIIYEKLVNGEPLKDHNELARRLVHAVEEAGVRIFNEARADRSRRGMGTTATIAALLDSRLFIAQVGDSRAYVMRNGKLVQVSRDQSLVNQLIEAGQLTEEEAETFEHNNIILQALGTAETVQVDLTYVDLRRGDLVLLCSDGLSGMIRGEEIRDVLRTIPDPLEACRELTERANRAGGHDNITVIVAQFDGPGLEEPSSDEEPSYQKYPLPELPAQENTLRIAPMQMPDVPYHVNPHEPRMRVGHTIMSMPAVEVPGVSAGRYNSMDDPVELPTTGFPPSLVGFMVLGAMVLAAVAGFLLLR
ncbi:MAG TPA: Stp1/IreP family PP2C-type Ser/Thr phosphatase [Polyangiaceae bacterium]|nr:Stp1/IreP family PP2C-type Ser/Thr phosphatase [Polyangiaceae bacterium]